ncbi:MAG: hypothetical protein H6912_02385 [Kordiimonadaceae bacterium]|nr:hypothetical protein [Kordiimonadaceae bacterium]
MKFGSLKIAAVIFFALNLLSFRSFAQSDEEAEFFQKYQAMVIIEEANQHCPLLSRLEAEVLNGQIVFANSNFSGKLDRVEKFKKEARIYARRAPCNSPEIMGLIGLARQEASDSMVNQLLLSRQIHLLDQEAAKSGEARKGMLLDYLTDAEWGLLDNLYLEVKDNYLTQASQEDWDKYEDSLIKVAEEKTTQKFLSNENLIKTRPAKSIEAIQATANNNEIFNYYFYLDKSVRAFVEGSKADEDGYPYSRPANDFTNWLAYRPRDEDVTWMVSYPGCGGSFEETTCILVVGIDGNLGVVLNGEAENVALEYRNPENKELAGQNKAVEGPIGTNEKNEENYNYNLELMSNSPDRKEIVAVEDSNNKKLLSQVGTKAPANARLYLFPEGSLNSIEQLSKNDLLKLTITTSGGKKQSSVMPMQNYHQAKNWATTLQ